ncbi:MAG: RHS repeat protein, partial [Actinomycetia bacterium]|nr:RHS repeat protein [Actinomycetes bacterium]
RTYDSRDLQQRDFSIGWSLDVRQGSYRNNRPPGDGWQLQTGFIACDTALESKSHLTVVRLSDQEVYRFALRLANGVPRIGGGCSATAEFEFIDGPLPGTTLAILGNDQVFQETPSSNRVLDEDTFATYEPRQVRLTTRDGRIFDLDLTEGVTKLEDLNGNQLSITPAGITHSSGRGIVFERDAEGRIERITDPLDRINTYAYDVAGDLVSFTDRAGTVTRFTYDDDHRLLDSENAYGVKPVRNEYDTEGRLVRHIDAFGKVIEFNHDRDASREIMTNRLGHSRILEYDARGNVVRETDESGHVTTRVFDGRENLLSETDPLNRTTTYFYSADDDLLTLTGPLDNVTSYTYDSRGRILTETNPGGGVTTMVYDSRGRPIRATDALGQLTTLTYDSAGNTLTTTDPLGQVTTFEYDSFGNRTREIDALGNESYATYDDVANRLTETQTRTLVDGSTETLLTSFTYDDLDRLTVATAADSTSISTTYDLLGRVTSRTDPLGHSITMSYDLISRLVNTSYPDGTAESQSYDAEGRLTAQVDRGGRTTTLTYDPTGRLLATTYPDGSSTDSTYDADGQLIAFTNGRGHTTSFVYDAAGRRTTTIDSLGHARTYTYDEAGNQTSATDARGQTTTYTYDALNRPVTATFPVGTTSQITYDPRGRRIVETDQAGIATEFGYDALDRLTSVKNALEHVTTYTYDEVGNRLTQTDANGHTTSFEYDQLGRQIARSFSGGARESMTYHADGTLASHTDFNGAVHTFQRDTDRRVTRHIYPDGSQDVFTYTPSGRRSTVTDSRGTTSCTYDSRDRLTQKIDPAGHQLGYTYDLDGNRTSLTATVGTVALTTSYTYDPANRLATVIDNQGGVTSLDYDLNGNRSSLVFPNSVTTSYTYDTLNQLTDLRSENSLGDVLQHYQYTLGPAGNRTRIDEHDGTTRHYLYDVLYRLTRDRITDSSSAQVYQHDYIYDPVGNRQQQTVEEGSGPTVIGSTYDDRDRLLTAGGAAYGWDANGNLLSRSSDESTTYQWDFDNRLSSATLNDGTVVDNTYDVDGHRVRTAVTLPDGSTTAVDYLVDTTGFLSHVVAEIVDDDLQTFYTRAAGQLIELYRPATGTHRYYHADGLGSIRALSDETGATTDRYAYTAFGEQLEHVGGDPQPYRFAGEPSDPNTGFYYNRARWLDVETGRFVSVDPFLGVLRQPDSLHRYSYVENNPALLTDPSGLTNLGELQAALNAISGLSKIALRLFQAVEKARAFVHAVNAVFDIIRIARSPELMNHVIDAILHAAHRGGKDGVGTIYNISDVVESMIRTAPIMVATTAPRWLDWFSKNSHRLDLKGLLIWLPNPGRLPQITPPVPTGLRIPRSNHKVFAVLGGTSKHGTIVGFGFWFGKRPRKTNAMQQVFRMDTHNEHESEDPDEQIFPDPPFHYHMRKPGHKR